MPSTNHSSNHSPSSRFKELLANTDKKHPVLVTGVSGYVAGVLVRRLLEAGFTVHGTHRETDVLPLFLVEQSRQRDTKLQLFTADLLEPKSFDLAVQNCRIVFHLASPFLLQHGMDVDRELLQPAVQGTRNVLSSCENSKVQRVVLTSSVGAIYGDAADSSPDHVLTSADWNRTSTLTHQPYFLSKTMAEQAAWVLAGSQKQYSLVVLNPALILGPGLEYYPESESFRTLQRVTCDHHWSMWLGCPHLAMPVVDVRDVATAQLMAALMDEKDLRQGRHLVVAQCTHMTDWATIMSRKFPAYPIPRMRAFLVPKWLACAVIPYMRQGLDRQAVARNLNVDLYLQPSEELKIDYRPLEETLCDMYQQMIDAGVAREGFPPEWIGLSFIVLALAIVLGLYVQFQDSFRGMFSV